MFSAAAFFLCIFFSCAEKDSPLPERYVNISVNLNEAGFKSLQTPGGYAYLTGGNAGIFVFRFDNSIFYAYDRACPNGVNETPLVFDDKTKTLCHTDTVNNCNSRFSVLLHGAVCYGVSKFALKEYDAVLNGNLLKITNNGY
jgi:hypothetical protein